MKKFASVILLAGGIGSRMQSDIPKQFLELNGKPIAAYSLEVFLQMPEVAEIIIVCDPVFHHIFHNYERRTTLKFAEPGARRQDSVYNGFQMINPASTIACIHDSARPFVSSTVVQEVLSAANKVGAAAAAAPLKFTVKEADAGRMVVQTPDRSRLWEIQTPQACRPELLRKGFEEAISRKLTVTDDVSLVELCQHPVQLVTSNYTNIKITTPDDLLFAKLMVENGKI